MDPGQGALADGVYIHLTATNYDYKGFFAKPKILPPGAPFVRHPIPQAAWDSATLSAGGGTLTSSVVVAAGGVAYGPITETWNVAKGRLKGTVYYQSYGTKLAKNYGGAIGGDGMFGGATLAIKPGRRIRSWWPGPTAARRSAACVTPFPARALAWSCSTETTTRRARATISTRGYTETAYPPSTNTKLGWVGMSPDGSLGLGNAVPIPGGANGGTTTALYDMTNGNPIADHGPVELRDPCGHAGVFPRHESRRVPVLRGPGDSTSGPGDGTKLVVMDFDGTSTLQQSEGALHGQ